MALAECRRYPTLQQALVACSALESAGFHPLVFDQFRASMLWTEQFALNGIRLMTPASEADAARLLLADLDPEEPPRASETRSAARTGQFLLLAAASWAVGWPIAGFRRRDAFHRVTAFAMTVLFVALVVGIAWRRWRG